MDQVKEKVAEKLGEDDANDGWTSFVVEVGEWLLDEKAETKNSVVKAIAGLISYGATTEEKLQNIANDKKGFADRLNPKGVPDAICDLLFARYVVRSTEEFPEKVCDDLLKKYIPEGNTIKLELKQFKVMEGFKTNLKIPATPGVSKPHMLLFDVENEDRQGTEAYAFIKETSEKGPCALYGTSGAGKTRSVLEFLSKNYGFYFLAGWSLQELDFGSQDMSKVLNSIQADSDVSAGGTDYAVVNKFMSLLLFVRVKVFRRILQVNGSLSPYEWLLAQLHPTLICPKLDIFFKLTVRLLEVGLSKIPQVCQTTFREFFSKLPQLVPTFYLFVDEAQAMLDMASNKFMSSGSAPEKRSMYPAVVHSLTSVAEELDLRFPVFTGTGVRVSSLELTFSSYVAKVANKPLYDTVFSSFDILDEEKVRKYLSCFMLLDGHKEIEVSHVCKWLKGRPRWSATFVQFWMRGYLTTRTSTNIVEAIETYVDTLTRASSGRREPNRRWSDSLLKTSAYSVFERFLEKTSFRSDIIASTLEYALSGCPVVVCSSDIVHGTDAVEKGFCVLERDGENKMKATFGEPLMVEAGLQYIGVSKHANEQLFRNQSNSSAMGSDFERWMLPILQSLSIGSLEMILNRFRGGQTSQHSLWSGSWLPRRSAYGVIAKRSTTIKETVLWMEASVSDKLVPGSVPPFCFPDRNMGPDLIYFLFNDPRDVNSEFKMCVWQMKLTPNADTGDAWKTTIPEHFYKGESKKKYNWPTIYEKIFGGEPGINVEQNKKRKRSVLRGLAAPLLSLKRLKEASEVKDGSKTNQDVEDPIVWVDRDNSKSLLGETATDFLRKTVPTQPIVLGTQV